MVTRKALDRDALAEAIATFTKQRDRGTALIGAAWLDDALEELLRSVFRKDKRVVESLLRSDSQLGTLSGRSKLAYALGLIEPTAWRDIDLVRKIRNSFAHTRAEIRFSYPAINDRCRQLHAMGAYRLGSGTAVRGPRQRFVLTVYFLVRYVLGMQKLAKPVDDLDGYSYGSWIRRFVKTMTLSLRRSTPSKCS